MGLSEIILAGGSIVVAALLGNEVEARAPQLADLLRRIALRAYTGALKDRLDEEWSAYLADTEGAISKLLASMGFCVAGLSMRLSVTKSRVQMKLVIGSTRLLVWQLKAVTRIVEAGERASKDNHSPAPFRLPLYWPVLYVSSRTTAYVTRILMRGLVLEGSKRKRRK